MDYERTWQPEIALQHIELIYQFRNEMVNLVRQVESSGSMGHFDINKVCEDVVCGLFRELFGLRKLRNLNKEEKQNFPGIDLADDEARIAIQVTSDKTLEKIKDTLTKVIKHDLSKKYDRVIIYNLVKKQQSYAEHAINKICENKFSFNAKTDVLDFRDMSSRAATAKPTEVKSALDLLVAYTRGTGVGLSDEDFDPPTSPMEILGVNLLELYFPPNLYIAEIREEILMGKKGKRLRNHRKAVKEYCWENELQIPSDFEASEGRLFTFHNLEERSNPYNDIIDEGTIDVLSPSDYYEIDEDHLRKFKSLLRFVLQHKLYKHHVLWQHHEGKFIFLPQNTSQNKRRENWIGQKESARTVFERKFKRGKTDEVLSTKHFAFSVEFLQVDGGWYAALTPDWFFSYGDQYSRSFYGDKLLSGLKRMEKNRSVYDQFRFLAYWLESVDRKDLFSESGSDAPSLSFAASLEVPGGRSLNEQLWEPLQVPVEDDLQGRLDYS